MTENKIFDEIKNYIENNNIVLFMKGTPSSPECGFSAMVVGILQTFGLPFKGVNVLESNILRQGIKDFSNWPTIPQLYINKEFIGGSDIVREMYESGELINLMNDPQISITNRIQAK